ncbi:RING finger and CHY zinc finger domain-containing protein 1-like [Dendronephthya gigantea]|uniref:RING finger and CHY zinc finger domain-containing protein 1-like n=1 Tax=Dendronephthya gigantea TaxID=151771 RepID=UPI00106B49F4|nr:RING finger and CHY zinc finger domain-containing protein 1-like [Dendronephthya gigantea]
MVMPPVSNQLDIANVHHQKPSTAVSRRNRLCAHEDVPNGRARDTARGSESRSREASNGITENSRHQEHRTRARDQNARFNFPSTSNNPNGRSERSNNVKKQANRLLCNHYKRRCMVKFECCDKYWACHRCHNETSTCQQKKLKSRDTTMVKCMECGKEQQFGQFCVSCNTQFADFYCGLCKHLTGRDDHPYHCEKCGICRIHGDRSFHCDVCGVCLDVQLRGNHKCRPDSAHDNCGICLEDAFTGCQILPCSHKVHKECSKLMIQNGMTRCPICRESFAHKLQRKPVRKQTTKTR